jgi:hypothetical protein
MHFDWQTVEVGPSRVTISSRGRRRTKIVFERVMIDDQLRDGAQVMATQLNRELLRELNQAGFARERDVMSRRGRKADDLKASWMR